MTSRTKISLKKKRFLLKTHVLLYIYRQTTVNAYSIFSCNMVKYVLIMRYCLSCIGNKETLHVKIKNQECVRTRLNFFDFLWENNMPLNSYLIWSIDRCIRVKNDTIRLKYMYNTPLTSHPYPMYYSWIICYNMVILRLFSSIMFIHVQIYQFFFF